MKSIEDTMFMLRAIELAEKGRGKTSPNPLVGAVIVYNNEIIAEGYHQLYGKPHAEIEAINNFYANKNKNKTNKTSLENTTMYVTLEPCKHFGKTPPCTEAIIKQKINRVVIGITDPNPIMSGKSIELMRKKGIQVELINDVDVISKIEEQNKIYIKYITKKKPYVLMKAAMTLDGKIASASGDSKWVTNKHSRQLVHKWRQHYASVIVGANTVKKDDPMLTCRLNDTDNTNQAVRVILSSKLDIPMEAKIVNTAKKYKTIIAYTDDVSSEKIKNYEDKGLILLKCKAYNTKIDINDLTDKLYAMKIDSILLEGGGEVNFSFLEAGCVDELAFFVAPKIVGGSNATTPVAGKGVNIMENALKIKKLEVKYIDEDLLIYGKIENI